MRKGLLLAALFFTAIVWNGLSAQVLFTAPDTVCVRQKVQLTPNVAAQSYYWGFCSGFLVNTPTVTNLGAAFQLNTPSGIEVAMDGGNYYAFVLNRNTNELIRLNYGASLGNTPTVSNFGSLGGTLPAQPNKLTITQDATGKWFLFVTGGATTATSSLARIDFTGNLGGSPNSVLFGNPGNVLNGPSGIFVALDGGNYYGFTVNAVNNRLIRLNFGANISLTPTATDLGNIGTLSGPNDITAIQEGGQWFALVANTTGNTITRLAFGPTLATTPAGTNLGNFSNKISGPTGISIIRDCGATYAFVTNALGNDVTRIDIGTLGAGPFNATNLGAFGGAFASPSDISRVIREHDNLYAYVVNATNNSLTQIAFAQCTNASIPSSTQATPPVFSYNTPGLYNLYLSINEGLPNATVECQQIRVLPIPPITFSPLVDTLICQGDTISLKAQSPGALSYLYSPSLGLLDTMGVIVRAAPQFTVTDTLHIAYANGCLVDTARTITVSKVKADAGVDRMITDGAATTLGGPLTSQGSNYFYEWFPQQYLGTPYFPVTSARPSHDITYYLRVTNELGCVDIDTAVVHVSCNDINLPNAFRPENTVSNTGRFGILNRQIVQLNYFRIFDRWGKEVFSTTDVTRGWDGQVNGNPAPYGVYVWEADGFCLAGQRFTRSGNVTLIR